VHAGAERPAPIANAVADMNPPLDPADVSGGRRPSAPRRRARAAGAARQPWLGIYPRGAHTRVGRYTQRAHLRAAFLEGIVQGVLALNEFVAKKTLGASDLVITALVMAQPISWFFSSYWSNFLVGREKRSTFLLFGLLGRLSLFLVLAVHGGIAFAAVIVFATLMFGSITPAQNSLFQTNYDVRERGRAFGLSTSWQSIATIGAAVVAGRLYDNDPRMYRWTYTVAAIAGFASCWLFYRIRFRRRHRSSAPAFGPGLAREMTRRLRSPFAGSFTILREDRDFRRFETAYMGYGLAFMMLQPVIPIFLVESLHVDYSQASNARGLVFYFMMVLFSPIFGWMLDRSGPVKLSTLAFLLLAFFPLTLTIADSVSVVYLAFCVYGIAMAAVNVGWTMGPIHFAGTRDSASYMGAHVALVGLRGLIGGPIGILLFRLTGTARATFLGSAALFLIASLLMGSLGRDLAHRGEEGRP
jgi:predicted MFS family arabinose efflux permease